jgi:Flp pilus assembly protein TadG
MGQRRVGRHRQEQPDRRGRVQGWPGQLGPPASSTLIERGSATVELLVLSTLLMVLFAFGVAAGRWAEAKIAIDDAASSAAIAAAQSPTWSLGEQRANEAAATVLASHGISCAGGGAEVTSSEASFAPEGHVSIQLTCRVSSADVSFPGIPGSVMVTGSASSPIEPYRVARP